MVQYVDEKHDIKMVVRKRQRDAVKRGQQAFGGLLRAKSRALFELWILIAHCLWTVPLVAGVCVWRRFSVKYSLSTLLGLGGSLAVPWMMPHYVSGFVPVLVLLIAEGGRRLCIWGRRTNFAGRGVMVGLILVWVLLFLQRLCQLPMPLEFGSMRHEMQARLEALPGRDLVIVRYHPDHNAHDEWVYNSANIDGSDVVWAREMGPDKNTRLLSYFGERRVWLLEADGRPPKLVEHKRSNQGRP